MSEVKKSVKAQMTHLLMNCPMPNDHPRKHMNRQQYMDIKGYIKEH